MSLNNNNNLQINYFIASGVQTHALRKNGAGLCHLCHYADLLLVCINIYTSYQP